VTIPTVIPGAFMDNVPATLASKVPVTELLLKFSNNSDPCRSKSP
jgi:hypothetical protein